MIPESIVYAAVLPLKLAIGRSPGVPLHLHHHDRMMEDEAKEEEEEEEDLSDEEREDRSLLNHDQCRFCECWIDWCCRIRRLDPPDLMHRISERSNPTTFYDPVNSFCWERSNCYESEARGRFRPSREQADASATSEEGLSRSLPSEGFFPAFVSWISSSLSVPEDQFC